MLFELLHPSTIENCGLYPATFVKLIVCIFLFPVAAVHPSEYSIL